MARHAMTKTRLLNADPDGIAEAARIIAAGGRVAMPTETVYGLAADATNDRAVAGIFAAKDRPSFNPLIVHLPDMEAAARLVVFSETATKLARAFWPGPLTLVLPRRDDSGIAGLASAGLPTLAVRVPAHPVARALLAAFGKPLAAPSANPSGRVSPTTAAHVIAGLDGRIEAVLDGGAAKVGLESTILGFDADGTPRLLRAGGIPAEQIAEVCGTMPGPAQASDGITAPGQMQSHYAPHGAIRLNATRAEPGETMVGFGEVAGDLTLSETGDLTEAAARIFDILHTLDQMGVARIAVAPVPARGLGLAINDRLARAAAPRP